MLRPVKQPLERLVFLCPGEMPARQTNRLWNLLKTRNFQSQDGPGNSQRKGAPNRDTAKSACGVGG